MTLGITAIDPIAALSMDPARRNVPIAAVLDREPAPSNPELDRLLDEIDAAELRPRERP